MSRKKNSAPFSLFAFQDAITSVCGVVVLVTLILALELTRKAADDAAAATEPLERQADELRKEIDAAREDADALEDSFDFSSESNGGAPEGLTLSQAQRGAATADQRLTAARNEESRLKEELARAKRLEAQTETAQGEVAQLKEDAKSAQQAASAAQEQSDAPLDPNAVFYAYSADVKEKPWFVDLGGSRTIVYPSSQQEKKQEFGNTDEFMAWADGRSRKSEYFVLIVRPSGAGAFDVVSEALDKAGFKTGIDLVAEDKTLEFIEAKKKGVER